jgi:hypothetical protein
MIELQPPPENTVMSNGQLFLLDTSGDAIAVERGQADDLVLMAQGNRPIYYLIQVNDVYAYLLTAKKNGQIHDLQMFPTEADQLKQVLEYAARHGISYFPDERASVVEIKSSWIELPEDNSYADYVWIEVFRTLTG